MNELMQVVGYGFLAMPFIIACLLAILVLALIWGMYRNPIVGVVSILSLAVWEGAAYQLGGINIGTVVYPQDLIFVALGIVVLMRVAFKPGTLAAVPRPLWILLLVLAGSFALGLGSNGKAAGVEFRSDYYFWTGCLYFLSFPPEKKWLDSLLRSWTIGAVLLCLVVWYRLAADAFDLDWVDPIWRYADVTSIEFRRVAPASVAFFLSMAVLISIAALARKRATAFHAVFLPALILTILILQHRSVWGAVFLAALVLLVMMRRTKGGAAGWPVVAVVGSVLIVGALLGSGLLGRASSSVAEQAARATSTSGGTFVGRVDGWKSLLSQWSRSGVVGLTVGKPFGSGYERHQGEGVVTWAPHNYYVQLLLRTGIIGLAGFTMTLLFLWAYAIRARDSNPSFSPALVGGTVMLLMLYCVPYSPIFPACIVVGAVLSLARRHPKQSEAVDPKRLERFSGKGWVAAPPKAMPSVQPS